MHMVEMKKKIFSASPGMQSDAEQEIGHEIIPTAILIQVLHACLDPLNTL